MAKQTNGRRTIMDCRWFESRIRHWLKVEIATAKRDKRCCPRYSGGWNYAAGRHDIAKSLLQNLKEFPKQRVLPDKAPGQSE